MEKYLSTKIKFISAFLMVSIVFLHSYNYTDLWLRPTTYITEGFNFWAMFQYFISNGITRFATPLFYAISGFLFYFTYKSSISGYLYKLKSRFFSLIIPFVIWNMLAGLFLYSLTFSDATSSLLTVNQYVGAEGHGISQFYMWLIKTPAFQTWYLQQLIIFTIISPIIYWLIKYTKGLFILLLIIPWIMDIEFVSLNIAVYHSKAFLFYSLGAFLAINNHEDWILKKPGKMGTAILTIVWIVFSLLNTIISALDINSFDEATGNILTITKIGLYKTSIIIGIFAVWYLFDYIIHHVENNKLVKLLVANSFFIFLMHEPLLNICYQLGLYLGVGNTDFGHMAMFIGFPLVIIALAIVISLCIKKICPPLLKVLTGNRSNRA